MWGSLKGWIPALQLRCSVSLSGYGVCNSVCTVRPVCTVQTAGELKTIRATCENYISVLTFFSGFWLEFLEILRIVRRKKQSELKKDFSHVARIVFRTRGTFCCCCCCCFAIRLSKHLCEINSFFLNSESGIILQPDAERNSGSGLAVASH